MFFQVSYQNIDAARRYGIVDLNRSGYAKIN